MASDHIYIRGLRVMALIGVLPAERLAPQPLQIDVEMDVNLAVAGQTDDLGDTANYGAIADAIAALVRASSDILLERLITPTSETVWPTYGLRLITFHKLLQSLRSLRQIQWVVHKIKMRISTWWLH